MLRFWDVRGTGEEEDDDDDDDELEGEEPDEEVEAGALCGEAGAEAGAEEFDKELEELLIEEEEEAILPGPVRRLRMGRWMVGRFSSRLEDEGSELSELDMSSLSLD